MTDIKLKSSFKRNQIVLYQLNLGSTQLKSKPNHNKNVNIQENTNIDYHLDLSLDCSYFMLFEFPSLSLKSYIY